LLLDNPNSAAAELVRMGGFEIERSSLADANARARSQLERSDGSDIDAIRAWADHEGIGFLLLRHRGPEGVVESDDARLQIALEALAHVEEEGDAARYLAIPVGDLRELGEPTVAPRRRSWLDHEGVEALEALLEQPLVQGRVALHPMHEHAVNLEGRFDSGKKLVESLEQMERRRSALDDEFRSRWASEQLLYEPYQAGRYVVAGDGSVQSSERHRLMASGLEALEFVGQGDERLAAAGSLRECENPGSWLRAVASSADGRIWLLPGRDSSLELWRRMGGVRAKEGCAWEASARPVLPFNANAQWALHHDGLLASVAPEEEGAVPVVRQIEEKVPAADIRWPDDLEYASPQWVEWGESPLLAVAARPRGAHFHSFVVLWHPSFGPYPYQAGLDSLGLSQAFKALHARPGHAGELLVSSEHEGGALYRLRLPKAAVDARLEFVNRLAQLPDHSDADRSEPPDAGGPWRVATLLREEPLAEIVVDPAGSRVATLSNLPGTQSLRVVAIEEGQSVELSVFDGFHEGVSFDAEGEAVVTHVSLELDGVGSLSAPRRHALPKSLHRATVERREALLQVGQPRPGVVAETGEVLGPESPSDPEAGREVLP
jgi:hypothetical protein